MKLIALVVLALAVWPSVALAEAWYALIPPVVADRPETRAPLGQWEQVRAFDSAEACEKLATAYARQIAEQTDNAARGRYRPVQYIRCVHAADPRLRGDAR